MLPRARALIVREVASRPPPPRPWAPPLPGWEVGLVPFGLITMTLFAVGVGIITGIAYVFREPISLIHNLFFLRHLSFAYDSSVFTPFNPWGPWVILVPAVGAIGITFIIANFAPEAKGHGVLEDMDAIYYNGGASGRSWRSPSRWPRH